MPNPLAVEGQAGAIKAVMVMSNFSRNSENMKGYIQLGFDVIPLQPNTKIAIVKGWPRVDPVRQWRSAPENANVAIRAGGENQTAIIDCDTTQTFGNVESYLAGLGIMPDDCPIVQTASIIGRHDYITLGGILPGDSRKLAPEIGPGELRYGPGSYVVAPDSVVDGVQYKLISGDFRQLPKVEVRDILPILENKDLSPVVEKKEIPRKAGGLLHGAGVDRYPSRSEAEQALIMSLVNAGHTFEAVLDLFTRYPCAGKFNELRQKSEKKAIAWLRYSYNQAADWSANHDSQERLIARALQDWAQNKPWPGRTGAVDRAIYLAHIAVAIKAGRLTYQAGCRELAELGETSSMTATRATKRLLRTDLLKLVNPAVADNANYYSLGGGQTVTLPKYQIVRECNAKSTPPDVFRWSGLGKSAGEIYQVLVTEGAKSVSQLATRTGRCKKTIRRCLSKMAKICDPITGEYLSLVTRVENDLWQALPVDLEHVAQVLGVAGATEKQKQAHERERRLHNNALLLGGSNSHSGGAAANLLPIENCPSQAEP